MSPDASRPWITRQPARWSMPACLQPRAARQCRIVHAEGKHSVRPSGGAYRVRPNGRYQLEIAAAEESDQPSSVSIVTGPARRSSDQEERVTQDGRTLRRLDLQIARDDEGFRFSRYWWSRIEPLVVRLQYADGRDDCEHRLWLVVTPRRIWALLALISSAVLYGVVPWASRTILDKESLPAAWSHVLELLSRREVWGGLMLLVAVTWLGVVVIDRILLWVRWHQLRDATRQEVLRYLQLAEKE